SLGLREPGVDPVVREFLQNVVDLSERAALLTRQLLAFARKPALSRRPTSMPELVRTTADLVGRTLQMEVTLQVQESAAGASPLTVEADTNQLQQALINLALNARDALQEGVRGQGSGVREEGPPVSSLTPDPCPLTPDPCPLTPAKLIFRVREAVLEAELAAFPQNVPEG